jgi:hypothetical protein
MKKKNILNAKRKGNNKNISNATTPITSCAPESKILTSIVPLEFTHD